MHAKEMILPYCPTNRCKKQFDHFNYLNNDLETGVWEKLPNFGWSITSISFISCIIFNLQYKNVITNPV